MSMLSKRIRLCKKQLENPLIAGDKRRRIESRLAFLTSLPSTAKSITRAKQQGEGGWRS